MDSPALLILSDMFLRVAVKCGAVAIAGWRKANSGEGRWHHVTGLVICNVRFSLRMHAIE